MKLEHSFGPDKIAKPVSALAMVPKTGAITRVGRQAYTVMMLIAREQGAEQEDSGMFAAPLNTVISGFDGTRGTSGELKRLLRSMVTHVEWQSPSPGEINEWGASHCCPKLGFSRKRRELVIVGLPAISAGRNALTIALRTNSAVDDR
ncbi:MAG: hypothetical protein IPF71_17090 [Rhodoferax sp.]|nr:hypothetical protein [Rhodoferax sp.]